MKQKCRYCGQMFDIRGLGPHEAKCTKRPALPVTDPIDRFWAQLSKEEKVRLIQRYLDEI